MILFLFPFLLLSTIVAGQFRDFVANDTSQTCTQDQHSNPFNRQVRGTNLGGWLVLEPWITPSLFYQFLSTQSRFGDQAPEKTGMDMSSFCTALGEEEANKQLRLHWQKFVTEDDIAKLASYGVNSLRIPVGDWMFKPYPPYIKCTEGSIEELDRVLDLCLKYDIDVLIDIHGHRGSQNGFDNSGQSHVVRWTSLASSLPIGTTTFEHWPIRTAEWVGTFDPVAKNYSSINHDNIQHSLDALLEITLRYKDHQAMLGVEPINEPWELTPIDVLKDFYWKGYKQTKIHAPEWKFVMHDSFRFGTNFWGGFMSGCPDIALDTHIYQAWMNPGTTEDFFNNACQQKHLISTMEETLMPVIVGEWSLATDNCAMWINGFNDNLPGFPKLQCNYERCPESYLGKDYTGLPLDRTKPIQGPYGTGTSGPSFGYCPLSSNMSFDLPDNDMFHQLGQKKVNAFNYGHGWYFWNFKTEIDPKWDFMRAVENGWLPANISSPGPEVDLACQHEDTGDFLCHAKRGVARYTLESGLAFACSASGVQCSNATLTHLKHEQEKLQARQNHEHITDKHNMPISELLDACDKAFNRYWHLQRTNGATCDFGGAAQLSSPVNVPLPPLPQHIVGPPAIETQKNENPFRPMPLHLPKPDDLKKTASATSTSSIVNLVTGSETPRVQIHNSRATTSWIFSMTGMVGMAMMGIAGIVLTRRKQQQARYRTLN